MLSLCLCSILHLFDVSPERLSPGLDAVDDAVLLHFRAHLRRRHLCGFLRLQQREKESGTNTKTASVRTKNRPCPILPKQTFGKSLQPPPPLYSGFSKDRGLGGGDFHAVSTKIYGVQHYCTPMLHECSPPDEQLKRLRCGVLT